MNKAVRTRQEKLKKKKRQEEIKRRFLERNIEAQRWCNNQGLIIYAASQAFNSNMVKLFVQKGVPFKPLNDKLYDQTDPQQVMEYIADIDERYELLYTKMKDKV